MKKYFLALFMIFSAPLLFAETNGDIQALVISADNSYVASEKNLEFASMDADRVFRALISASKVPEKNITNLKNPQMKDVDQAILQLSKNPAQKFLFYFSGHSDENGLHLKDGSITKSKFHELLGKISAKVKVVILDSCFSGALKSKGAQKAKAIELVQYNVDEPTGSVVLTSSSGTELSYESDKLKGSIFTYHLVSGLYGQADANSDGVVTIEELYQYVYAQTKFQSMVSGGKVQSPEFESRLTGQGALVVSYPARINGQLELAKPVQGELTLTASKGINFFRFYKNKDEERTISLPKGKYDVSLLEQDRLGIGQIEVSEHKTQALNIESLVWQKRDVPPVRAKGAQPKFLFGLSISSHPAIRTNEEASAMSELFLLSPSSEALAGRWRLGVYLGGEEHRLQNSNEKVAYNRMSIGGEGNYRGWNRINNEWLVGLAVGVLTSNNNTTYPSSASLTHFFIGSRFYPTGMKINWDILFGVDTIKSGTAEDKSMNTLGVAISF